MNSGSSSESLAHNASSKRASESLSTTGTDTGCGATAIATTNSPKDLGETARQHWRNVDSKRNHQNSQVDQASPQIALWSAPLETAFYSETKLADPYPHLLRNSHTSSPESQQKSEGDTISCPNASFHHDKAYVVCYIADPPNEFSS
ncbi:hypothetical protein PIB30_069252 [Stylosanthes scabra]|uniref:Uncharacterized protein n=1 Tax=Stylosanthes scabra TaxID=79078 RepID=A0ABU6ZLT2_9FABA|nr:hypothetical protein [Stylosanthes scabra]